MDFFLNTFFSIIYIEAGDKMETVKNNILNEDLVKYISKTKQEPEWITNFRLKSLEAFNEIDLPDFGPNLDIDFDKINYYKKVSDEIYDNWNNVDNEIKDTFDNIGLIKAEKEYLGGVSTQYESEVIYHNMLDYVKEKGIIFLDTDSAIKKHPDLFKKYFNKLVNYKENKFTALNGAVFSGGTFIYIPKNTKLDRPLQSYFRINSENMGQFERTIIVVDDNSELHYIEGCTAPINSSDSLHAAVVEIYVGKNAKCRYTTIQNWSENVYNLVTKRAIVDDGGMMEWIDGNIGSKITMKYPCCVLKGDNSMGRCITIGVAHENQIQDTGAKMIHIGKNSKSEIISKSISNNGGEADYRGSVEIKKCASNSKANIKCDSLIMDKLSKSDTIPKNINNNETSILEHEASISKLDENKLLYLMSRGLNEEQATELMLMGFIGDFRNELPVEYAVELNNLLKNNITVIKE